MNRKVSAPIRSGKPQRHAVATLTQPSPRCVTAINEARAGKIESIQQVLRAAQDQVRLRCFAQSEIDMHGIVGKRDSFG